MMTRENFYDLVQKSMMHQKLVGANYTYFTLDEKAICPFCDHDMKKRKQGDKWLIYCDCDQAVRSHDQLNEQISIIEEAQDKVMSIFRAADFRAMKIMQRHFKDRVFPKLQDDFNKERDDILGITEDEFYHETRKA